MQQSEPMNLIHEQQYRMILKIFILPKYFYLPLTLSFEGGYGPRDQNLTDIHEQSHIILTFPVSCLTSLLMTRILVAEISKLGWLIGLVKHAM
jgi:hypothetical protein